MNNGTRNKGTVARAAAISTFIATRGVQHCPPACELAQDRAQRMRRHTAAQLRGIEYAALAEEEDVEREDWTVR